MPHSPKSPSVSPAAAPDKPTRDATVAMTLLGIDWGARRIGLAIKPAGQDWPLPQGIIDATGEQEAMAALREAITRAGADGVVVGLPLHPDPEQSRRIKRFCRKARRATTGVRWFFIDESLTTQAAAIQSLEGAVGRRPDDDLAAALILETFIQSCR